MRMCVCMCMSARIQQAVSYYTKVSFVQGEVSQFHRERGLLQKMSKCIIGEQSEPT